MTTPMQIARNHCANWHEDGICSGIDFRESGSLFRFRKEGCACLLKTRERCRYLEEGVFLMGKNEEWAKRYPAQARAFEEAVDRYMRRHSGAGLAPKRRKCPD